MDILNKIQTELNAPKNQFNKFGKYNYRSCEDVLEGLKPLLKKYECSVILTDDLVLIGDRYYIKATAKLVKDGTTISEVNGFAREGEKQAGMSESQLTGATSTYARKYALNGLFAIDDNKDADTNEHHQQTVNKQPEPRQEPDIKVLINNVLNLPSVPEADRNKWISDFRAKVKIPSQEILDQLISLYGAK